MKFVCRECNYRFESEKDKRGDSCPYCGKKSVEKQKSACEILDEVE